MFRRWTIETLEPDGSWRPYTSKSFRFWTSRGASRVLRENRTSLVERVARRPEAA